MTIDDIGSGHHSDTKSTTKIVMVKQAFKQYLGWLYHFLQLSNIHLYLATKSAFYYWMHQLIFSNCVLSMLLTNETNFKNIKDIF